MALAAVEAARGYQPDWTLWKAAVALIAAALTAQLWQAQAAEAGLAAVGATPEAATGLEGLGTVRPLESGHTAATWVVREMVGQIGRRRSQGLMIAAIALGLVAPLALAKLTDLGMGRAWMTLALVSHLLGVAAHRWLFFAQAEHAVGTYYGQR
jgi:DMSO reductase anchor subunit